MVRGWPDKGMGILKYVLAFAFLGVALIMAIGMTMGNAIGIRKGNTVAQPLRVALMPPQGDKDAFGGPVRSHSSVASRRADHPADR
jgi:hypothetical protein